MNQSSLPSQSDFRNSPENMLIRAISGESTESIIRSQEKDGQLEVVYLSILPQDGLVNHRVKWESVGFQIGDEVDDLFVQVRLPQGWSKRGTDHDMWSEVLDEHGRKRASVFYKAAFYDRRAFMDPDRRYKCRTWYADDPLHEPKYGTEYTTYLTLVIDNGTPGPCDDGTAIWQSEPFENPRIADGDVERQKRLYSEQDQRETAGRAWLTEHYPEHNDPFAYW